MQNFRDLHVSERSHRFALAVRRASRGFPRHGYAELKSQIVRAAESIPANIVEGCGAATRKEFARFLDISVKSTSELEYHLILARDNGVLSPGLADSLTREVVEIRRMLCGLRRALLNADRSARRHKPHEPR
jgi:four helix bundle protein